MDRNKKLLRRLLLSLQIRLSRIWRTTPFFIQSQMDLHPSSAWFNARFVETTGGFFPSDGQGVRRIEDHECWDGVRRDMLLLLLRQVEEDRVAGAFAELGVYKGGTARLIHGYAPERELHLFDTFEGFDQRDAADDLAETGHVVDASLFCDTSLASVKSAVGGSEDKVHFHKGFFPDSIPSTLFVQDFAFVHLDADLYAPIRAGLDFFYPRLSPGGTLVVHDYNAWPGARQAVDEFVVKRRLAGVPMPDKSGSFVFRKSFATVKECCDS